MALISVEEVIFNEKENRYKVKNKEQTLSQSGAKGGKTTLKKYGKEHFRAIGQKGGESTARKHGKKRSWTDDEAKPERKASLGFYYWVCAVVLLVAVLVVVFFRYL